jgi:hypothetical protein
MSWASCLGTAKQELWLLSDNKLFIEEVDTSFAGEMEKGEESGQVMERLVSGSAQIWMSVSGLHDLTWGYFPFPRHNMGSCGAECEGIAGWAQGGSR